MPFPPGVRGCGAGKGNSSASSFELITAAKAIDETNAGNYMLRNMARQESLDLLDSLLLENAKNKKHFIQAGIGGLQIHGEKKGRSNLVHDSNTLIHVLVHSLGQQADACKLHWNSASILQVFESIFSPEKETSFSRQV
nr:suppressor of ABI3-5 isoform X1 [Tanacetum cinerariifolium]